MKQRITIVVGLVLAFLVTYNWESINAPSMNDVESFFVMIGGLVTAGGTVVLAYVALNARKDFSEFLMRKDAEFLATKEEFKIVEHKAETWGGNTFKP